MAIFNPFFWVLLMGRRTRKKRINRRPKFPPKVSVCVQCGHESVRAFLDKDKEVWTVACAKCTFYDEFPTDIMPWSLIAEEIDAVNYSFDRYRNARKLQIQEIPQAIPQPLQEVTLKPLQKVELQQEENAIDWLKT